MVYARACVRARALTVLLSRWLCEDALFSNHHRGCQPSMSDSTVTATIQTRCVCTDAPLLDVCHYVRAPTCPAGVVLNVLFLSWLYAYYCFDYKWALEGVRLPNRLYFFECNWAYFAGKQRGACRPRFVVLLHEGRGQTTQSFGGP
jgi:hypothetical protein